MLGRQSKCLNAASLTPFTACLGFRTYNDLSSGLKTHGIAVFYWLGNWKLITTLTRWVHDASIRSLNTNCNEFLGQNQKKTDMGNRSMKTSVSSNMETYDAITHPFKWSNKHLKYLAVVSLLNLPANICIMLKEREMRSASSERALMLFANRFDMEITIQLSDTFPPCCLINSVNLLWVFIIGFLWVTFNISINQNFWFKPTLGKVWRTLKKEQAHVSWVNFVPILLLIAIKALLYYSEAPKIKHSQKFVVIHGYTAHERMRECCEVREAVGSGLPCVTVPTFASSRCYRNYSY